MQTPKTLRSKAGRDDESINLSVAGGVKMKMGDDNEATTCVRRWMCLIGALASSIFELTEEKMRSMQRKEKRTRRTYHDK